MKPLSGFAFALLATIPVLPGCGGGGSSSSGDGSDRATTTTTADASSSTTATAFDSQAFFDARIAPRLNFCATCHVPGGLADTDEGDGLLLSGNSASHYDDFYAAWRELGEGTTGNPILVENAVMSEPHSGGKSWPAGSKPYLDVTQLFGCWDNPAS